MIIQKRICDNCKKEIEERDELYYKTNITVVNATVENTSNSISGDYCKECFKDICEALQNIEPEEETEEVMAEPMPEPDTSVDEAVEAL